MLSVSARGRPEFATAFQGSKPKNLITTYMRITSDVISEFLNQQSHRITHVVVAHTRYTTFERTDGGMARIVELAKKDCAHFRNCFNRTLSGRRAMKHPDRFQPLLIATLEGSLINTDRDLTLHYNFAIGNLLDHLCVDDFLAKLRGCWVARSGQRDDIWFKNVAGKPEDASGWIGYILKEAREKGNMAVWDFENTQIPYAAFDAC